MGSRKEYLSKQLENFIKADKNKSLEVIKKNAKNISRNAETGLYRTSQETRTSSNGILNPFLTFDNETAYKKKLF
jgi:CRISPR/Cas system-associated protein Cas5 (RAMP superfamily)